MILIQSWPPHLVLAPLAQVDPPFLPWRDAGYSQADFTISLQDCVYGLWRAKEAGLISIKDGFNLEEYPENPLKADLDMKNTNESRMAISIGLLNISLHSLRPLNRAFRPQREDYLRVLQSIQSFQNRARHRQVAHSLVLSDMCCIILRRMTSAS